MRVVLFGDSLTFGYGVWPKDNLASLLQQARPQWEILNRGVNGDTTREAEERFEADVLSCHPDLVTFFFGSNDSAPREGNYRTLVEFTNRYGRMMDQLKAAFPNAKAMIITPPPVDETVFMPWNENRRLIPYCQACRTLAKERHLLLADFWNTMQEASQGNLAPFLQEDGCHLSERGYLLLRDTILSALFDVSL